MQNSPRHHIARRKFAHGVILGHEAMHFKIAQVSALAAQRFRKQESRGILQIKSRRMKLDELHVADFGAGAKRHSDAVTSCNRGIRGIAVELPHAAAGEEHGGSRNVPSLAATIYEMDAADSAVFDAKISRELELADGDLLQRFRFSQKGAE